MDAVDHVVLDAGGRVQVAVGRASEFFALGSDAYFTCTALELGRWTFKFVPTFAYEFTDADAPQPVPAAAWLFLRRDAQRRARLPLRPTRAARHAWHPDVGAGGTGREHEALLGELRRGRPAVRRPDWPRFHSQSQQMISLHRCGRRSTPTSPPTTTASLGSRTPSRTLSLLPAQRSPYEH